MPQISREKENRMITYMGIGNRAAWGGKWRYFGGVRGYFEGLSFL